ncbi:PilW family protein [Lysobacter enzymogenes]|uniref:PilW family protein n=1 Tax=Lysobacter enzymogenes TaxID=69 RepID=UPI001F60DC35|nr:PilW family protein [Lysobacter enzymogenes]
MSRRLQAGLSLIELMVALLLSLLLILGLVQIFSASRASYLMAQGLARAQETSRFAIDALQHDTRMAGHFGCVSDQAHFIAGEGLFGELFLSNRLDYTSMPASREPLRFDFSVRGFEARGTAPTDTLNLSAAPVVGNAGDWVPAVPNELFNRLNPKPVRGSDLMVLRFLSADSAQVNGFTTGAAGVIRVAATEWAALIRDTPTAGVFGIADCRSAVMFQATAVGASDGTSVPISVTASGVNQLAFDGSDTFASGQARVYRAESFVYYVGLRPANVNDPNGPQPTLYRARFNVPVGGNAVQLVDGTSEEIVEGVENMQLLFGQDMITDLSQRPSGIINGFQTAATLNPANDSAGGWRRVGGVQVGLLIRSADPASTEPRNLAPRSLGTTLTLAQDKRYRAVYESNIALRNRLFGN